MQPIISIENLGKKYHILKGAKGNHGNPEPPGLFRRGPKLVREDFWALKDFSLDIMPGDRVGIIGRNGAGKSTLLKLLSRITEPTTGKITMRGRVASLLEVGTGFHPELTGRENIFLNGAILGMTRKEIRCKFDEIIDFAGVEEFLDVPVKRYSSGMYVRLGFAVAAHLEPEILIVDEVLAVGDAEFQRRCLGKMEEMSTHQGRTVLFVSHNTSAITTLCQRVIVMDKGKLILDAVPHEAMQAYLYGGGEASETPWRKFFEIPAEQPKAWITECEIAGNGLIFWGETLSISFRYKAFQDIHAPQFCLKLVNAEGLLVATLISSWQNSNFDVIGKGEGEVKCIMEKINLMPGAYNVSVLLWVPNEKICEAPENLICNVLWKDGMHGSTHYDCTYGTNYIDAIWDVTK